MASNLYEILGINRDAQPEEIRKAYKKRALATHPDRFVTKSEAEKNLAEEQFRKVNNAYEVLNDPEKRRAYNIHGVWPVPDDDLYDEPPHQHFRRHTSQHHHSDPFFEFNTNFNGFPNMRGGATPRHHGRSGQNQFTDPFELFEAMFGDMHREFNDPFAPFAHQHRARARHGRHAQPNGFRPGPMSAFPFGPSGMGLFNDMMGMPGNMFPADTRGGSGRGNGRNQRWTQETRVTTSVNGVTQSTWTRVDSDGNEHVTHTHPDGREEYSINGVQQPAEERFIPPPPPNLGGDGFPPPPMITGGRPSISRHRSPEYDGPYNSAAVRPDNDWEDRDYHHRHEPDRKRRWWRAGRR